jgi:formylmethanofuran dehydrogenase subunit D
VPKLFLNCYSIYVIYKCDCWLHNATWGCGFDIPALDQDGTTEPRNSKVFYGPIVVMVEKETEDFQGCIFVPYKMISQ